MDQPLRDLNDVSTFKLSAARRERLFALTNECVVCWTNSSGWPVRMPHSNARVGRQVLGAHHD